MPSLTIRNITETTLEELRILSRRERRSMNNELLLVLEEGLSMKGESLERDPVNPELQSELWAGLCGRWQDERDTDAIIADIRGHRSEGREVSL